MVQASDSGSAAQQWRIVNGPSGYVTLINVKSEKVLDNTDGSFADGNPIQQWEFGPGNPNQLWRFTSLGGGYYIITNRLSGRALDLRDGGVADGTPIQQWEVNAANPNQQWGLFLVR